MPWSKAELDGLFLQRAARVPLLHVWGQICLHLWSIFVRETPRQTEREWEEMCKTGILR